LCLWQGGDRAVGDDIERLVSWQHQLVRLPRGTSSVF
jgi:hypothetical protein